VEADLAQSAVGLAGMAGFLVWAVKRLIEGAEKAAAENTKAISGTGDRMVSAIERLDARMETMSTSLADIRRDLAAGSAHQQRTTEQLEAIAGLLDDEDDERPGRGRRQGRPNGVAP
jgi:hypothetical protein